ncbi:MAG TPA: group III truncated hemoglobin [Chitinophagaceae bacterium]
MKEDIKTRKDIEHLINSFYDKVKRDEMIGFIFNDVARVNWEKHLPVMYDFWESIIFSTANYNGNPMLVHLQLNRLIPLTKQHFDQWLKLFTETTDELFEGKKATLTKERALNIAAIIQSKILTTSL